MALGLGPRLPLVYPGGSPSWSACGWYPVCLVLSYLAGILCSRHTLLKNVYLTSVYLVCGRLFTLGEYQSYFPPTESSFLMGYGAEPRAPEVLFLYPHYVRWLGTTDIDELG